MGSQGSQGPSLAEGLSRVETRGFYPRPVTLQIHPVSGILYSRAHLLGAVEQMSLHDTVNHGSSLGLRNKLL